MTEEVKKKRKAKRDEVFAEIVSDIKTDKHEKGVILCAISHPYYAHTAHVLAQSLKLNSPDLKIALVYDDESISQLTGAQKSIFDIYIKCRQEWVTGKRGGDPYKFKLHLDEITPFDKTMYMDVDMIFNPLKNPGELFDELSGIPFTCVTRSRTATVGHDLKSRWMNLNEVAEKYGFQYIYDISSEVVYFEKPDVFKVARAIYSDTKVDVMKFGAGYPDEAFLILAIESLKYKMPKDQWLPSYWEPSHFPKRHPEKFILDHYLISIGGAFVSDHMKKLYSRISDSVYFRRGIKEIPYQPFKKYTIKALQRTKI